MIRFGTAIYPLSTMSSVAPLPEGLFFDLVLAEEVEAVHLLEIQGKLSLILIMSST